LTWKSMLVPEQTKSSQSLNHWESHKRKLLASTANF
jgi:hypothetical protein